MGAPNPLPTLVNQTSFEYTSTSSTFIMDIGGLVALNITFLSPVNPTDLNRQSLTFSYLDVIVSSADGNAHDVQLYTDITAGQSQLKFPDSPRSSLTILPQSGRQATEVLLPNGNMASLQMAAPRSLTINSTGKSSYSGLRPSVRISRGPSAFLRSDIHSRLDMLIWSLVQIRLTMAIGTGQPTTLPI